MSREQRRNARFDDCGYVEVKGLSTLPGILNDISLKGCKVRFPIPVHVDMENDYELRIKVMNQDEMTSLFLISHPQWVKTVDGQTEVGFTFLRSPGTLALEDYIKHLDLDMQDDDSIFNLIIEPQPVFVSC